MPPPPGVAAAGAPVVAGAVVGAADAVFAGLAVGGAGAAPCAPADADSAGADPEPDELHAERSAPNAIASRTFFMKGPPFFDGLDAARSAAMSSPLAREERPE